MTQIGHVIKAPKRSAELEQSPAFRGHGPDAFRQSSLLAGPDCPMSRPTVAQIVSYAGLS
jgi:hypothetical protein